MITDAVSNAWDIMSPYVVIPYGMCGICLLDEVVEESEILHAEIIPGRRGLEGGESLRRYLYTLSTALKDLDIGPFAF